jgi:GDSL-like Lipase/Acylhydrolase family
VFRHPDGTQTRVNINRQGWNSTKPAYSEAKMPGVLRIAVVGDSYVHGSFVDVGQGFPEVIERQLNAAGVAAEVLRFGMDGAPLSQYLHMLRREVGAFKPDLVVVQLIHNDFDESYRFLKTRYASAFLKIGVDEEGAPKEIAPADFAAGRADTLRELNTFRYLYYKTGAYLRLKSLVSRLWWGGDEDFAAELVSSGVDIRKIADHAKNRFFARYVLSEMKALSRQDGFKLAFAMDGVREAVYAGKPADSYEVHKLNRIAYDLTSELGLPFLDLQDTFQDHYAREGRRFEFAFDWHWNVLGNRLAGEAVARFLLADPRLLAQRPAESSAAAPAAPKG